MMIGLTLLPVRLQAHEGEDHGDKQEKGVAQVSGLGTGAQGERFEVVITPDPTGGSLLFLADLFTSAPVDGAAIEVEAGAWQGKAEPTRREGLYRLAWVPPVVGTAEMTIIVTKGESSDLLLVQFVPPVVQKQPVSVPQTAWNRPELPLWAGLAILNGIGLLLIWRRAGRNLHDGGRTPSPPDREPHKERSTVKSVITGILLLAASLMPAFAWSHGGEDHGGEAGNASPAGVALVTGRTVALPKAVQFLLQLRTTEAEAREVSETLRLVGRVIPDPAGYARVQPSALSRVGFDPDLPPPVAGQWVKRGASLAVLNPILSINERNDQQLSLMRGQRSSETTASREMLLAPIDGQITDVHIVPGEVVTESTQMVEIVDPKRVRVEAILYDLAQANRIVSGSARTRIYPERAFPLKLVGVSPKLNAEHQGLHVQFAVEESFGALKIGMPIDVYAATGTVRYPVAIPGSALTERGGIPTVWVKNAPEQFEGRMVRPGRHTAEWVEILEGLAPGDKVVVQGQNQLAAMR
ncbi:MAG: efflux RND transporter periplasmic adaptor subunit [Magnetococcales bacterium]|nr:efflux RND transporter periplasmic adaptor subunit [Magnetococcales bacterium]